MKHIWILGISIALVACDKPDRASASSVSTETQGSSQHLQPPKCDLSIRSVQPDGSLAPYAFLQPHHVSSIEAVKFSPVSDSPSLAFYLTAAGKRRLLDYTKENALGKIAVFCGQQEVLRPVITAPFAGPVFIEISAIGT
jgi:preprotein translocase subunit SecD